MKLLKIKPYHIQEELNKLAENGHTSLVKFARTTLSQIFKQAIANKYIFKNPMDGVHTPTVELGSRRALTQEERAAINSVDDFTLREKIFIYLWLYAGMRRGEALALMPKDINFKKNEISISKTVVYNSNQPYIKNGTKTKAGVRIVTLIEPLKSLLKEYIKTINGLYLFSSNNNPLTTRTSMSNLWNVCLKKINAHMPKGMVTNISPHYLRHTYATDLYYAGVDIKTAQYLLGHTDIKTTLSIYTTLQNNTNDTANKLTNYLFNQSKISQNTLNT